jgi:hypothetical protein
VACRIERRFHGIINPSILHHITLILLSTSGRKRGKEGPVFVAVFFMLSGDYMPWADISLHLLVLRFNIYISSRCRLICLFFLSFIFFGLLGSYVNIDWFHTLPIHRLFFFCSVAHLYALRSPLHAYHSLLVWPATVSARTSSSSFYIARLTVK